MTVEKKTAFRGLMAANFVLHMVSAIFAGIWISDMLAPDGVMHVLDWVKVGLSVIALAIGLTFSSYIALKFIVNLPDKIKHPAKISFITSYGMAALVLAIASASVLAAAAGERAHMEATVEQQSEALVERRHIATILLNRAPILNDCVITATAMSGEEIASGAFSEAGRNVGRVSITIKNISSGCEVALRSIFESRVTMKRHFERAERILMETRQVIDGDQDRATKAIIVRKLMHELGAVLRAINDAYPTDAMQSAADATSKDWFAVGLPESAATALTGNFSGLADRLTEGLDDVAALKAKKLPRMEVVPAMAYLAMYPQSTIAALVIGIILEGLPLGTIILGFVLLGRKEDDDQAAIIVGPKARAIKRGRKPKNGTVPNVANDALKDRNSNAA
jgi:hypothetical protein